MKTSFRRLLLERNSSNKQRNIYVFIVINCNWFYVFSHSLTPLDVEFMKAIHSKVNIVPVIAKADTLTLKERDRLKRRVGLTCTHTKTCHVLRRFFSSFSSSLSLF